MRSRTETCSTDEGQPQTGRLALEKQFFMDMVGGSRSFDNTYPPN